MKKAYIKRDYKPEATYGVFFFEEKSGKVISLASLERPWLNNESMTSCIPEGRYIVTTTYSNRFKRDMWLVNDVQNRSSIRIHEANLVQQLSGCIALGLAIEDINRDGVMDITSSKAALAIAHKYLGEEFELTIS